MAAFFSSRCRFNECIEKSFFRAIMMICLVSCITIILYDLLVFGQLATSVHITALFIFILLVILYATNRMPFEKITSFGLLSLCALFTYRGLVTNEFNHVTYTLLITIGFVNALVSRNWPGTLLTGIIFSCLMAMLFKELGTIPTSKVVRQAIPYMTVFFIVTICSSFLKRKYQNNQIRLKQMLGLLNQKNLKINQQNALLKNKFNELEQLNQNLEDIIAHKTVLITEKNKQLADIVYANAHTLRGPLARMLGLLNLIELDCKAKEFYIEKLHNEARNMDGVLQMLARQIETNIHEE